MKKNNSKILTFIGLSALLGISYLTPNMFKANKASGSSTVFTDDFNSYNSYSDMSSKWINGFFVPDASRTMDATSCSASNNEIVTAPKDAATHGKVYHMKGVEYNYVSIKGITPKRFEVDFDYYLSTIYSTAWFGIISHSVERGNDQYPPRYARCTDCYNSLLTIQTDSANMNQYKPYTTLEIPGDMIDTHIGGEYAGEGTFKFTAAYQTWHHAKFTCNMNTAGLAIYSLYVDDVLIGKAMNEDAKYNQAGYISLTNCLCDVYYDNVVVTSHDDEPLPDAPIISDETFTKYTLDQYSMDCDFNNGEVIALFDITNGTTNPPTVSTSSYFSDYTENKLIFTKDYINSLSLGDHHYLLSTDGGKSTFTLTIENPDLPPTFASESAEYKLGGTNDVSVGVNLHDLPFVSLKFGSSSMKKGTYELTSTNLIIKNDFLEGLTAGTHVFTLTTEGGSSLFTINAVEEVIIEPPVVLDTRLAYLEGGGYDLTVKVNFKKRALSRINYVEGIRDLIELDEYSAEANSVTIKSDFLDNLAIGEHNFDLYTDGGKSSFKIVVSSEMEDPKEAPTMIEGSSFEYVLTSFNDLYVPVNFHGEDLTNLSCDGTEIENVFYSFDKYGNSLVIDGTYLETLPYKSSAYVMLVSTDGGSVSFDLFVKKAPTPIDPEYPAPSIVFTQTREFTIQESDDVIVAIDLYGAPLDSFKNGTNEVDSKNFVYSNDALILYATYLNTLEAKTHSFSLVTSGGSASFSIEVKEKVIPPVVHEAPLVAGFEFGYRMNSGSYVVVCDTRGETIDSLMLDDNKTLTNGTDYSYSASDFALTFTSSFMTSLSEGSHKFELTTLGGPAIFNIVVVNDIKQFNVKADLEKFTLDIDLGGQTVTNIHCSDNVGDPYDLEKGYDYSIDNGKVVLSKNFISQYEVNDEANLTISLGTNSLKCKLTITAPAPLVEKDSYNVVVGNHDVEINIKLYGQNITSIFVSDSYEDFFLEEGNDFEVDGDKIILYSDYINMYQANEYADLKITTASGEAFTSLEFIAPTQVNVPLIVGLVCGGVGFAAILTIVIIVIKKKHSYSI